MNYLIKNGRVVNPAGNVDGIGFVVVCDGKIKAIQTGYRVTEASEGDLVKKYNVDQIIDAAGLVVMPGLVDMHVHFRDPGQTHKEDIETGSKAAVRGGVTTVLTMPNTSPVVDCKKQVEYVMNKSKDLGLCNVLQVGSVTIGMQGEKLSDYESMKSAGIVAISEDGKSVMDSGLYRQAMQKASNLDLTVLAHCEDINLVQGGTLNMGDAATKLGQKGISNAVEDIIEVRDIMLAEECDTRLHLCHCSTAGSYDIVKSAKDRGLKVSAEVCPHHFILTEDDITSDDANFKMNPPLRAATDRDALIKGLSEDVFDVISTDHAPHSQEEKSKGIKSSPFGIVGIETSLALTYTYLVNTGHISLNQMVEKMSYNPAKILGIEKGDISVGKDADITIFDPTAKYTIDPNEFASKGKNTPFTGYQVSGKVVYTIYNGKIVYQAN